MKTFFAAVVWILILFGFAALLGYGNYTRSAQVPCSLNKDETCQQRRDCKECEVCTTINDQC